MTKMTGRLWLAVLALALAALWAPAAATTRTGGGGGGGGGASSSADQPGKGKPGITIGTKDFTEEFILGELYSQALEAKGYKVNAQEQHRRHRDHRQGADQQHDRRLSGVHGRRALGRRQERHPRQEPGADRPTREGVLRAARAGGERPDAVPGHRRDRHHEGVRGQERARGGRRPQEAPTSFTLGARPEFKSRFNGLKGMEKVYGIKNAKFKQLALGLQYKALDKGDVDTVNVFSTDAQLASGKYKVLEPIPRACSASRTSTSSSTRTSTKRWAARRSWTSSTRSTSC